MEFDIFGNWKSWKVMEFEMPKRAWPLHRVLIIGNDHNIDTAYAGVPKMLIGNTFPQNFRTLRLVVVELLSQCLSSLLTVKSNGSKKLWVKCLIEHMFTIMRATGLCTCTVLWKRCFRSSLQLVISTMHSTSCITIVLCTCGCQYQWGNWRSATGTAFLVAKKRIQIVGLGWPGGGCTFMKSWEREFIIRIFSSKDGPTKAFCSDWKVDFDIGHGGSTEVTRHVENKLHAAEVGVYGDWFTFITPCTRVRVVSSSM